VEPNQPGSSDTPVKHAGHGESKATRRHGEEDANPAAKAAASSLQTEANGDLTEDAACRAAVTAAINGKTTPDGQTVGNKALGKSSEDEKTKSGDQATDTGCATEGTTVLTLPNPQQPSPPVAALGIVPVAADAASDNATAASAQALISDTAQAPASMPSSTVAAQSLAEDLAKQASETKPPEQKPDATRAGAAKADATAPAQTHLAATQPADDGQQAWANMAPRGDSQPKATAAEGNKPGPQGRTGMPARAESDASQPVANNTAQPNRGTDIMPALPLNAAAHQAASAAATAPAQAPGLQAAAQVPVPLAGVALAIASRAFEGNNHFEIRLDPPELGRIEVHLDVDRDGNVTSHLVAHRAETLDLLRRDMTGLQRALQDAGLKTADNGMQFTLYDQSANQQQDRGSNEPTRLIIPDDTLEPAATAPTSYARLAQLRGGLDIRV
jgi:flagellar hook-length control protein FliK